MSTMYSVKPFVQDDARQELPKGMYHIRNIHGDLSASVNPQGTPKSLSNLESRQNNILNQLGDLKTRVEVLARKLDVKTAASSSSSYQDVVIESSPDNVPKGVLLLLALVAERFACEATCYVHSSVARPVPEPLRRWTDRLKASGDRPMRLTWIWKDVPSGPVLKVSQRCVKGEASILRFLARAFRNDLYEEIGPAGASDIDYWIDSASTTLARGGAKEKASVLKNLNARLGRQDFLAETGKLSIGDVAMYAALKGSAAESTAPNNVKKWLKRRSEDELFGRFDL